LEPNKLPLSTTGESGNKKREYDILFTSNVKEPDLFSTLSKHDIGG